MDLLSETLPVLKKLYGAALADISIERLVIGIHFVGVKLSTGHGGVAYLPPEKIQDSANRILKYQHRHFRGLPVLRAAKAGLDHPFADVIRLATLNALSAPHLNADRYRSETTEDLACFKDIFRKRRVCMVGAIIPLIRRIQGLVSELNVIDSKEETAQELEGLRLVPPAMSEWALSRCETAVFTGATIANGSIHDLMAMTSPGTAIAIVGPTVGFVPDPLFARGVCMVGTSIISDIDLALEILSEGGGAYPLFKNCVRKINLFNPQALREHALSLNTPHPEGSSHAS